MALRTIITSFNQLVILGEKTMWFPIPNPFSKKDRRVTKSINTDSLDRPNVKQGYAHVFKQGETVNPISPVSPHNPVAWSIRNRGIIG